MSNFEYLLSPINKIKGVGKKTLSSFNKKKIFTIFDLLWHLPITRIETAEDTEINDLVDLDKLVNMNDEDIIKFSRKQMIFKNNKIFKLLIDFK